MELNKRKRRVGHPRRQEAKT